MNPEHEQVILQSFPSRVFLSKPISSASSSLPDLVMAIPRGPKRFLWFTEDPKTSEPVCFMLNMQRSRELFVLPPIDDPSWYFGTLLYGTVVSDNALFVVENILQFKGVDTARLPWWQKWQIFTDALAKCDSMRTKCRLPLMAQSLEELKGQCAAHWFWKVSDIHAFRWNEINVHNRISLQPQSHSYSHPPLSQPQKAVAISATSTTESVFYVMPNKTQFDIYYLYSSPTPTTETPLMAHVPDLKTSNLMNTLFPSDTPPQPIAMKCRWNERFKKWTPISVV